MIPRADPSIIIPEQPGLVLLLLVDNSQVLGSVWTDLRDYLLSLVQYIVGIHSSLRPLSRIFVVESNPASNNSVTTGTIASRYYSNFHDAIGSIHFNAESKNGFSLNIIKQALELLASTNAAGLHAIILAGSPPRDSPNNFPSSLDPFRALLAQYLAKERIQCHLMINPYEDMGLFTTLFEENLRLQHLTEKQIWFPVDVSKIKLRVSGHPDFPPQGPHDNTSGAMPELNSFAASLVAPHPTPSEQVPSSTTLETQEPVPSLVAQLQQVHGLTKKKVYGAKPVRKPFVSTEIYREGGRKSVTLPPPSPPDTSHGGRVPSSALAGRSTRLCQTAPMIPSPSRSPVDNVGPSVSSRSPVSGSLYAQSTSSPSSPLTVNNPHYSPPNQWPQVTRHPTAWSPQTSLKDDSTPANYQPIFEDKSRQIQNTASGNVPASAFSMPPFMNSASQVYPGPESSSYRHVPSHSTPTPPSSTSTSPSPNHLSRLAAHHPQSVPVNGMITHATSIARPRHIPHHIPRSVYRDELLSHLEVPSKPSLSAVPGSGPGTTGSSSASPMRTPPSALFGASVDGASFADYPFPTSTYTTPSHTGVSSPPHDFSQTNNDTLPNATATLESSSPPHWNTTVAATIRQMSTSIAPSSSGPSHVIEERESHFHDRNVMQLHSSSHVPTNIVLTPLTIPHYSLSPELSSGGLSSSGTSSSLNGWAG